MGQDYALVTNLMQATSFPVMKDWLAFLPYPPKTMLCYCGTNDETKALVRDLAEELGIALVLVPADATPDHRTHETTLVEWQLDHVKEPFCIRVNMDTVPYRTTEDDWLTPVFEQIERGEVLFATGSTQPFRADRTDAETGLVYTQRVSFNFMVLRPETWLDSFRSHPDPHGVWGRFSIEAVLEDHCQRTGAEGLRLMNGPEWRVFHVQVWDDRINAIRAAFRDPGKVADFLTGFEDDRKEPWERYFMHPAPPKLQQLITQWRIRFGKFRRDLFAR